VRLVYIPMKLFVSGNPAATLANIAAHESLFRFGMVATLLQGAIWIGLGLALYRLLARASTLLASLMMMFVVVSVGIDCINVLNDVAALQIARGDELVSGFDKASRDSLAIFFLHLHFQTYVVNELFWGLWLMPPAFVLLRTRWIPRVVSAWLLLAGLGWLALCIVGLQAPEQYDPVFNYTNIPRLGELAFALWLTVMGARELPRPAAT
jgi:Domain of unknown function (DUF4386)